MARILYLGSLLHQIKVPIAPRKLVRAIVETANLMESFPPLKQAFDKAGVAKNELGKPEPFDSIGVALLITMARPTSVRFLDELLDALEQDAPDATRERMLAGLRTNEVLMRMFIDAVWLEESKTAAPDWQNCIRVFEKCINLARRWNVPELVYCAARGIAIIRDEYQDDERGALAILELHTPKLGPPSITIENERATVLLHREHNEDALNCWDKILPIWQNPPVSEDTAVLFALNKAGKAAARASNWEKAAALFADGAARAVLLAQRVQAAGFHTDAAWALWKAGKYLPGFRLLCETFSEVEALSGQQMTHYVAKVQKSFGHILVCIKRELEHEDYGEPGEPPPGLASDPEASDKWQSPPMLWCLVFLAEIECYFKLEPIILPQARARVKASRSPLIHSLIAELEIRYALRRMQLDRLPQMCRELETSVLASKIQSEKGRTGFEEADAKSPSLGPTDQSQSILPTLLTHALIASCAVGGNPGVLIERWRENASRLSGYIWVNDWLDLAKKAFVFPTSDALAMLGDDKLPSDLRLLAATRLSNDLDAGVDRMFNAQVWIASWLGQSNMFWKYDVANHFAYGLARVWKKQCSFKATMRNPRLTVPEIERECDSKGEGIAKAAKILLAAANAVTIQLSDEVRKQLQGLAASENVNPYRFAIQA
jgi:hypothetical protein